MVKLNPSTIMNLKPKLAGSYLQVIVVAIA
jgi:hypothetical protein